jgi:hypothetical protein
MRPGCVTLDNGADISRSQTIFRYIARQGHFGIQVEGHQLPREHGNESGRGSASVDLPNRYAEVLKAIANPNHREHTFMT